MRFSLIIPVYNRPQEIEELLESLLTQTVNTFEVVVVEDGSSIPCKEVTERYASQLEIQYHFKANSGPGESRNLGAAKAKGDYLIILDSDCVLPEGYLQAVSDELAHQPSDAFGGPDRAHDSFSPMQKAINYSMTSFFTTGGIRGGRKQMDKFYPRSFNMGIKAEVYKNLLGFSNMRFGEDIDFSIRIFKGGYSCRLFPEAWVWHKRRTDLKKFFKQVHNSGIARINLYKKYPESLKLVHLLPMIFTIGVALLLLISMTGLLGLNWIYQMLLNYPYAPDYPELIPHKEFFMQLATWPLIPLALFSLLILIDATVANRNLWVGLLSVFSSFVQLIGYGTGFIRAWWRRCIRRKEEFEAFTQNFYK